MTYDIEMFEGMEPPEPMHDDRHYHHVEEVKPKKRRKKTDPRTFKITRIPWEDISHTELLRLCYYNRGKDIRSENELCRVLCRTLSRRQLIDIIIGLLSTTDLKDSPVNMLRDKIAFWQQQNWRYIYSQIRCGIACEDCSDACVMECFIDNEHQFQERG